MWLTPDMTTSDANWRRNNSRNGSSSRAGGGRSSHGKLSSSTSICMALNNRHILLGVSGRARVEGGRAHPLNSTEFDKSWLSHPDRFAIEPAMGLSPGPFHMIAGRTLFGSLGDSAPDRWGRVLMQRAERRRAEQAGGAPRSLLE